MPISSQNHYKNAGEFASAGNAPDTLTGRVLQLLPEIEQWFRSGYKTRQVAAELRERGIVIDYFYLVKLLGRFGRSESAIRRSMARNTLPLTLAGGAESAVIDLKRKDEARTGFRPNPNPKKEDLI